MLDRQLLTSAIRFWERGRIGYNAVLLVLVVYWMGWDGLAGFGLQQWLGMLLLAAAANIVYCAAYLVDFVVMHSDYAPAWQRRGRFMLWLAGTGLAAAFALFCLWFWGVQI